MELTEEQKYFLDSVCLGIYKTTENGEEYLSWTLNSDGKVDVKGNVSISDGTLTEIPVKFGMVNGGFNCNFNNLTTLKNCPDFVVDGGFYCHINPLYDYFKSIKEEDFTLWGVMYWDILKECPFLVNIAKKYIDVDLSHYLNQFPLTKLYYKDYK